MRICKCDPFERCKDCDDRYLLMVETADRGDDHFYCFATKPALDAAFEEVEKYNRFMGCEYAPHTAIKMIPRNEEV